MLFLERSTHTCYNFKKLSVIEADMCWKRKEIELASMTLNYDNVLLIIQNTRLVYKIQGQRQSNFPLPFLFDFSSTASFS